MSHLAARYYATRRVYRKPSWPSPQKDNRLTLSPPPQSTANVGWGEAQTAPECEVSSVEISEGYKAAIALLRSWRDVSEEDAQEERESWELLKQALDEDRYH